MEFVTELHSRLQYEAGYFYGSYRNCYQSSSLTVQAMQRHPSYHLSDYAVPLDLLSTKPIIHRCQALLITQETLIRRRIHIGQILLRDYNVSMITCSVQNMTLFGTEHDPIRYRTPFYLSASNPIGSHHSHCYT